MRKIKLLIEYDGTNFQGWQTQKDVPTIQAFIEKRLEKITKKPTSILGAGRTDSGVHALGQVAHFVTESRMTCRELLKALNSLLPAEVVVRKVEEVDPKFHAIKSSFGKLYRYSILNRDFPSALDCRFAHYIERPLDIAGMRIAAEVVVGTHDFTAFRGRGCTAKTATRTVDRCEIIEDGDYIRIEVQGRGFLKYMVRNIAGTLLHIGKAKMKVEDMARILESRDRRNAGPTAPSRGLCMVRVAYSPEEYAELYG